MDPSKWEFEEEDHARYFLQWLMQDNIHEFISTKCRSACLVQLVKQNWLARHFVEMSRGFDVLSHWLMHDCTNTSNDQLTYNTLCMLWIVSVHDFTLPKFDEHEIIEKVAKILDYYNKEKIVRIAMMLFESVMRDKECMDHLSMVNAIVLVGKLKNRVWVDDELKKLFDRLLQEFDANYQEFSSFDKWKKQVDKVRYTWSTVHTEKFWQHNFVMFNISENLDYIKKQIAFLSMSGHNLQDKKTVEALAVVCFDLGEFARFFPRGREFLS